MQLYQKSEELVKELEKRVQEEKNESFRHQYQMLLQSQRNASASLKSLAEARGNDAYSGSQQNADYSSEFATENHFDTQSMTQKQKNRSTMNDMDGTMDAKSKNKDSNK